jgi:hypothetical protein
LRSAGVAGAAREAPRASASFLPVGSFIPDRAYWLVASSIAPASRV